jgi:cell division transport system permease protein
MRDALVGLKRNGATTVAMILTVTVALLLVAATVLLSWQADKLKGFWYGKVEVSVFLCSDVSPAAVCPAGAVTATERSNVKYALNQLPLVSEVYYETKTEAYTRFKEQFSHSAVVDNITVDTMPESFRLKLTNPDNASEVGVIAGKLPGVERVNDQKELLERLVAIVNGIQTITGIVAGVMVFITGALTVNMVRVTAHQRRKESAIMRLVGASRWHVYKPFLLEAVITTLVGGLFTFGLLAAGKRFVIDGRLAEKYVTVPFVTWGEVGSGVGLVTAAGLVWVLFASVVSLRKYLEV